MKIRSDFVTNSSSSSFIVAFPEKIGSVEELQLLLFGYRDFVRDDWGDMFNCKEVATRIYHYMIEPGPLSPNYEPGSSDYWYDDDGESEGKRAFLKEHISEACYEATFGDENGSLEGFIEHNDVFSKFPYQRYSHH